MRAGPVDKPTDVPSVTTAAGIPAVTTTGSARSARAGGVLWIPPTRDCPLCSHGVNVCSLQALGALADLVLDLLAFLEVTVSAPGDGVEVHEYIGAAAVMGDKAEAILTDHHHQSATIIHHSN